MQQENDKYVKAILIANKIIIKFLIGILSLSLILASAHLIYTIIQDIQAPPKFLIHVNLLYDIFSLAVIVAIGYELIKSLIMVITSDNIPSLPIVKIAVIAVANKIITLDIKHTEPLLLFGLAALIAGLGFAFFTLHSGAKTKVNNEHNDNPLD